MKKDVGAGPPDTQHSTGGLAWRGLLMGLADSMPGISGGTIALVLGIYATYIRAVATIHLPVLVPILGAEVIALGAAAQVIPPALEQAPAVGYALLLGLVLASAVVPAEELHGRWRLGHALPLLAAGALAFTVASRAASSAGDPSLAWFFLSGFFAISAMLLPGVSGSTILLIMGVYEAALNALRHLQLPVILSVGLGVAVGALSLSQVLSYLLARFRLWVMAGVLGLILGSVPAVVPPAWPPAAFISLPLGAAVVLALWRAGRR